MDSVSTARVSCGGFPPDAYDRYVLGLLDRRERAKIDREIAQQCPVCLNGVQRSMNLWLVFANSLEQVEPAADFRARLVRIAELSNRVLTVPKRHKRIREPALLISSLVIICLILVTLLIFTWIAGRQSARLDDERANAEMHRLTLELTDNQVTVQNQREQIRKLETMLSSSGTSRVAQQKGLEESLSRAQAAIEQYKAILQRNEQQTADNSVLVDALSNPGVKLLNFKNTEGGAATAYAMVVENSRVVFVASNLAIPAEPHQYQLWLVRKDEARFVSAGLFRPIKGSPVVVNYSDDKEAITSLAGLLVTEEPNNGSSVPSGPRVLQTAGLAAANAN